MVIYYSLFHSKHSPIFYFLKFFLGSEECPKGSYATSIVLEYGLDPNNDILLAYEMNDHDLPPDHGYPLRLVIPGFVGGRQVKWLKKIALSPHESDNWYHLHDNKVLPSSVDSDTADKYWNLPQYTLYEMNVNSVITSPRHEECISSSVGEKVPLRGFAYSGGGRRVTRVEISMDKGESWKECEITYPENVSENSMKFR